MLNTKVSRYTHQRPHISAKLGSAVLLQDLAQNVRHRHILPGDQLHTVLGRAQKGLLHILGNYIVPAIEPGNGLGHIRKTQGGAGRSAPEDTAVVAGGIHQLDDVAHDVLADVGGGYGLLHFSQGLGLVPDFQAVIRMHVLRLKNLKMYTL